MSPRRALLALPVAAAPLVQLAGVVPHPELPDDAAGALAVVAEDPDRWFRIHLLAAVAAVLFVVAAVALASLVRRRGAGLAAAGAALLVAGGGVLAIAFGAEAHLLSVAADPSLDRSAMVALARLEEDSPAMSLLSVGFPLVGIGTLLLMAGLIRSRAVPRWQPALVVLGTLTSVAAAPGSDLAPLLFAPSLAGYLALATSVARGPGDDAAPAVQAPQPERVPV